MPPSLITCPHCRTGVVVSPEKLAAFRGKRVVCKACTRAFHVEDCHVGSPADGSVSATSPRITDANDEPMMRRTSRPLPGLQPPPSPCRVLKRPAPLAEPDRRPAAKEKAGKPITPSVAARRKAAASGWLREYVDHYAYSAIIGVCLCCVGVYGFYWLWGMTIAEPWLSARDKASDFLKQKLGEELEERIQQVRITSQDDGSFAGTVTVNGKPLSVTVTATPKTPTGHIGRVWPYLVFLGGNYFDFDYTVTVPEESPESDPDKRPRVVSSAMLVDAARQREAMENRGQPQPPKPADPDLGHPSVLPGTRIVMALPKGFRPLSDDEIRQRSWPTAIPRYAAVSSMGNTTFAMHVGEARSGSVEAIRKTVVDEIHNSLRPAWTFNEIRKALVRDPSAPAGGWASKDMNQYVQYSLFSYVCRDDSGQGTVWNAILPASDFYCHMEFVIPERDRDRLIDPILKSIDTLEVLPAPAR